MNPLLNRIYKTNSKSRPSKASGNRESSIDSGVLVPKLGAKPKLKSIEDISDRQKTVLIRPHIGKLPSLHHPENKNDRSQFQTEKHIDTEMSKKAFRSRRLSSHVRDQQISINFMTELNIPNERQPPKEEPIEQIRSVSPFPDEPMHEQTPQISPKHQSDQEDGENQDELFEYLNVLEKNKDLNEEFCYMNRNEYPYSFYIVDYSDRNKEEHLTVSLRGITYTKDGQNDFMTIQRFSKDVYLFRKARKIDFFANYIKIKIMNHWKIAMFRKKFLNQCDYVKQNLFSQNQIKQRYIQTLHSIYHDFCRGNFCSFAISKTITSMRQLRNMMFGIRKEISEDFTFLQKKIFEELLGSNTQSLNKFRKDKRVTLGTNEKLPKEESFLPFDNKKKAMKYTQLAKLKEFEDVIFRLIKYTDLVRFNLRIEYVHTSLLMSIKEMNNLFHRYVNRNKETFTSWIESRVIVVKESRKEDTIASLRLTKRQKSLKSESSVIGDGNQEESNEKSVILLSPDVDQIRTAFLDHKRECIKVLWNNYQNLIQKKDELLCAQHENLNEIPSPLDLRYYFQKDATILKTESEFQQALDKILKEITTQFENLQSGLLQIYNSSFMEHEIEYYLQNETLRSYLQNYERQRRMIEESQEFIEYGLVLLKMDEFKFEVKRKYDEKYRIIVTAIPNQVLKRTQALSSDVKEVYNKFKENPQTVRQFIDFYKMYNQEKSKLKQLEKQIDDLLEMETMLSQNGIKVPESSRIHITESQTVFRELENRFEQIEGDEQKERKRFEGVVENMIPKIEIKAEDLLKRLRECQIFLNPSSDIKAVSEKLDEFGLEFEKIKEKKTELFSHQEELGLGHKDLENYFALEVQFEWFSKLWKQKKLQMTYLSTIKQTGYGKVENVDEKPMRLFLQDLEAASVEVEAPELIREFKNQTKKLLHILKLSKLMATSTFQPQHQDQIRKIMTFKIKRIKDILFTREGERTIICEDLYEKTNIKEIENELSEIAFLSAQDSIIKKQLTEVQEYWKKTKIRFIAEELIGNGTNTLHIDQNEELHERIGLFTLTLKNIESSSHARGHVKERLDIQIKITSYLRVLFEEWVQVEKEWIKLLPMMTNCPSVKHQSNVYFEFTSVDTHMKKLIKQISDMSTMRKVVEDYQERKFLGILQKCKSELRYINKVFNQFLETKRSTYNRFYFLTDEQLITIIENVKDSRSFAKHGGMCFNCDQIKMDNELIDGFQTKHEVCKLRKAMLRGEPDEMFKTISENMKSSIKFAVRNLVPKMKIASNIEQELKENSVQVCMLCDLLIWTEMSETYLNATSYEEYQLLTKGPYDEMARLLPKIGKQLWLKLSVRLMQVMHLKQTGEELIKDQITKNDFKWKEQFKFAFEEDEITIRQFNSRLNHGLEYFPPEKITVPTINTHRFMLESYYACLNSKTMFINGAEGEGKRNMAKNNASFVGIYYKEVVCNSNLSTQYLMRFVQGAFLAGAWLSFYESSSLKDKVIYEVFEKVEKLTADKQKIHPKSLFMFIDHGLEFQRVSMFKFNNYTVVQPSHKRICEYLLQSYRFREWEQLTQKILSYLKLVKPLMANVMGSHMRLIRRIVDGAGQQKINGKISDNESDMVVRMVRKEIIDKGAEQISDLLNKALQAHFKIEESDGTLKNQYVEKEQVFKDIMQREDYRNILVIGESSCKSSLIKQALTDCSLEYQRIFPEAIDSYFTPHSIEYFNKLSPECVLWYDGNRVISEFSDMITSGYLLVAERKVVLSQKILIEIRKISDCSPSFIQNCQIIYVGNLISKKDKFLRICGIPEQNSTIDICKDIFGQDLQKIPSHLVETLAKFISPYTVVPQGGNIHRIVTWFMSVMEDEHLWQKNYGGKYTDLVIDSKSKILTPIDPSKFTPSRHFQTDFLYVPTKSTILVNELTNYLLDLELVVQVFGRQQSGKSSALKMLRGKKIELSISKKTTKWTDFMKKKLLPIRKEGRNFLCPIGDSDFKIIIDDIDLGLTSHGEFVRSIAEVKEMRDSKFEQYFLEKYKIVICSRQKNLNSKLDDCVSKVKLADMSKETLSTVFTVNFENFSKVRGINREVVEFLDMKVLKILLITYDDLQKLYTVNIAGSQLINVIKSIVSLPKKNSYISVQDFSDLFKGIFYQQLLERSFNKRLKHQLNTFYDNVIKITMNNSTEWQYWLHSDHIYKPTDSEKVSALIKQKFPHLIVYDSMVENVIRINNRLQCLDPNIVVIGRKGVGKNHIMEISCSINKLQILHSIEETILFSLQNKHSVLIQSPKAFSKSKTMYQLLSECQVDEDLEKFLSIEKKQKFRQSLKGMDITESTDVIRKIRQLVKFAILVQQIQTYLKLCDQYHPFNDFSVSLIEEWPIEAIIKVYDTDDDHSKLHAQLFLSTNELLISDGKNTLPMASYELYIKIYKTVYKSKQQLFKNKYRTLNKIYQKFNESCTVIREWQTKVEKLESEIKSNIQDLSNKILASKLNSFVTSVLTKQMHGEQQEIIDKKDRLQLAKAETEAQLKQTKKILSKIEKIISSLQRTEMGELKKIYRSNEVVGFGLHCLCILFNEEPNEKSINKILADSNLLMKMKSSEILEVKNAKLIAKIKNELPEFEGSLKSQTSETPGILIDWMKAIIEYWQIDETYQKRKVEYKQLQSEFEKVKSSFSTISDNLKEIHDRTIRINEQISRMEVNKTDSEKELIQIRERLDKSGQIIPILLKAESEIVKVVEKLKALIERLRGNSILLSFVATYLPLSRLTLKHKLLQNAKKQLRAKFISFSDNFISEVIQKHPDQVKVESGQNSLQDLNMYLIEELALEYPKIIIDPERKTYNYLESFEKDELIEKIVEKAEDLINEKQSLISNGIYHSTDENLKIEQKCLLIDWKVTAINPHEKLFSKIAFSKKPEYFIEKKELNEKIYDNLSKIDVMKVQLYEQICESEIRILDDDKFLDSGKQLIALQHQTAQIESQVSVKVGLIQKLYWEIQKEVDQIFIILNIFREIRFIGLDLMLDAASQQGDSIQNVINWCLANLEPEKRDGFLLAVLHAFSKGIHKDLLECVVLNQQLRFNDVKVKKPQFVGSDNWEKVVKISAYSENLKYLCEMVQKNQKQFESWMYDYSPCLPNLLKPSNLSFVEHMFIVFYLKPKAFPQIVSKILSEHLNQYTLSPLPNQKAICQSNPIFPVICSFSIWELQRLAQELNANKYKKLLIGQIRSESEMKRHIWASMEEGEWLVIYGCTQRQDILWLQKIVYYVMNYQAQPGFRVFYLLDSRKYQSAMSQQEKQILGSKYLTSVSLHLYPQSPTFTELAQHLNLTDNLSLAVSQSPKQQSLLLNPNFKVEQFNELKSPKSPHSPASPREVTKSRKINRNMSMIENADLLLHNESGTPKQQLTVQSYVLNKTPSQNMQASRIVNHKSRLERHLLLAHIAILKRHKKLLKLRHNYVLMRITELLTYIEDNQIPLEFNIEFIVQHIQKFYTNDLLQQERQGFEELIERIVDETKFVEKTIYGLNVNSAAHVDKNIQNNHMVMGVDESFFNREATQRLKYTFATLDTVYDFQNIKDEAAFLRTTLSRIPNVLTDKQINNQNYLFVYNKEEAFHNGKITSTYRFLEWINSLTSKEQVGEQTRPEDQFNWKNLLRRLRSLTGEDFERNELRKQIMQFCHRLKKAHDFLLYWNPSSSTYSLNPANVHDIKALFSTYMINYFSKNGIKDAHNYYPTLDFKKSTNDTNLGLSEGIVLTNMHLKDFKFNTEYRSMDILGGEVDGEDKAPLIVFKAKKLTYSKKEDQETVLDVYVKTREEKTLATVAVSCVAVFNEWFLRRPFLIVE